MWCVHVRRSTACARTVFVNLRSARLLLVCCIWLFLVLVLMLVAPPGMSDLMMCVRIREWFLSVLAGQPPEKFVVRTTTAGGQVKFKRPGEWFRYSAKRRAYDKRTEEMNRHHRAAVAQLRERYNVDAAVIEAALASTGDAPTEAEAGAEVAHQAGDATSVKAKTRTVDKSSSADPTEFSEYVRDRGAANAKLRTLYNDPLFRQVRFNRARFAQRADSLLVRDFKDRFGGPDEVCIAWGDWSQTRCNGDGKPHRKGFAPVANEGLRTLFQRAGYLVVLVDEAFTSKRCHACEGGETSTFRKVRGCARSCAFPCAP